MNTQDLKEIFAINAEATRRERERCLQAVDGEPELPGDMTDEMWAAIAGDRDAMAEALRIVVRQTKAGIRERIIAG
jgi:hypothetical protein